MLDRAFDHAASFSGADIALIEPVAQGIVVAEPADERTIRQSIGSLAASMPAQGTDGDAGRLKLATYTTMLAGCDRRALAYACRRVLSELDWFPTVHQLTERIAAYVSPEAVAIGRARTIMRAGRRVIDDGDGAAVSAEEVQQLLVRIGRAPEVDRPSQQLDEAA